MSKFKPPRVPAETFPLMSSEPIPQPDAPEIFIARQPIFDRRAEVYGYELLFRSNRENRFSATDVDLAAAVTLEQSANAFGLDMLVGERMAWVNLTRDALVHDYYKILPPSRTVIELLESVVPDAEVIEACRRLKTAGYLLALDDYTFAPGMAPLLAVADLVKVDFMQSKLACDRNALSALRSSGARLLAEKVETLEEHRNALAAGYDYFQGYYYCRPEMIETRDLAPSKLAQLRFLAEVMRPDTTFERLEGLFRQDVTLTTRLLRYLNSAAFGWRHEIPSLRHALALLGLDPLRQWATMMGFVALGADRPRELVITGLSRARFAEELARPAGLPDQGSNLFLTGMLSVVDAMVGRPLREILAGLAVPAAVRSALTGDDHPIGEVYHAVRAYERGDWGAEEIARAHLPLAVMNDAYRRSVTWAEASAAN